jgi:hypothetical protein
MSGRAPEAEGTPLVGDEPLARVLFSDRQIVKSTRAVRPEAFDPSPHEKLSVLRHADGSTPSLESRCQQVATKRNKTLFGRADLTAAAVARSGDGMAAVAAARPHDPWHAHVQGYPNDAALRMSVMQAMAASATFVPAPPTTAG